MLDEGLTELLGETLELELALGDTDAEGLTDADALLEGDVLADGETLAEGDTLGLTELEGLTDDPAQVSSWILSLISCNRYVPSS